MAIPSDGGRLHPLTDGQWAEADSRLSARAVHFSCQDVFGFSSYDLDDSVANKDNNWQGTDPNFPWGSAPYSKTIPLWTRKGVGYLGTGQPGYWKQTVPPSYPTLSDGGTGTGLAFVFLLFQMHRPGPDVQVVDTAYFFALQSNSGQAGEAGVGIGSPTDSFLRIKSGTGPAVTGTYDYNDGLVHPLILQIRDTGVSSREMLVRTDKETLIVTGLALGTALFDSIPMYTAFNFNGSINFDYLDVNVWRGIPAFTDVEMGDLLGTLLWIESEEEEPPEPPIDVAALTTPLELYDPVPGSIGLVGRDTRYPRETGNG